MTTEGSQQKVLRLWSLSGGKKAFQRWLAVAFGDLYDNSELMWNVSAIFGPVDADGQVTATDDTWHRHAVMQLATRKREWIDARRLWTRHESKNTRLLHIRIATTSVCYENRRIKTTSNAKSVCISWRVVIACLQQSLQYNKVTDPKAIYASMLSSSATAFSIGSLQCCFI